MDGDLEVRPGLTIPAAELSYAFSCSGGPGGQNVNKVETRVQLRFDVLASEALNDRQKEVVQKRLASRLTRAGEVLVDASRHRERERNRTDARERLARLLAEALEPPRPRKTTRPTRASKRRRLDSKRRQSETKRLRRDP